MPDVLAVAPDEFQGFALAPGQRGALNFVWNHGEGATLAWRQGEPLKFVWRHGEYVWHVIRPAGRRPYLYLAGAP